MTIYPTGKVLSKTNTLVANVVTTVNVSGQPRRLRLVNVDGTADVWFTIDMVSQNASSNTPAAATPTVKGDNTHVLTTVSETSEFELEFEGTEPMNVEIKMISSGTPIVYAAMDLL